MRIFAISDLHLDYPENAEWCSTISEQEYKSDVLLLGGDISSELASVQWCFSRLTKCFNRVLFVPGNHDLWQKRDGTSRTSIDKFRLICTMANDHGVATEPLHLDHVSLVPLLGWYDYSFGRPTPELREVWADYYTCSWPDGFQIDEIARYFDSKNTIDPLSLGKFRISISHFLPRIDLIPDYVSPTTRMLFPVFGSNAIEGHIRRLHSNIHVYGHSHLNQSVVLDGVHYINNAYGYPSEIHITQKKFVCIYQN
ncbi:MAG TPA: metallophosphoesterase [Candidatus Angelobacter sp.]|nr:metallophosphoesterase [Candidatus Angelobacter sp.]